ncbi:MAG: 4Fe-4S binding protein [Thermoplasmatota archaeon]
MVSIKKGRTVRVLRLTSQSFFFMTAILGVLGIAMTGFIYPYFFCPASPGACAGCPIWVIEHGTINIVKGIREGYSMLLYLLGMFLVIGAIFGRAFCGWACPVGSLQDLFSFIDRKVRSMKGLAIFGSISIGMMVLGILVPYLFGPDGPLTDALLGSDGPLTKVFPDGEFPLTTYMWSGYLGALGVFLTALAGILFIRRWNTIAPSFVVLGVGAFFWVLNVVSRSLDHNGSPLYSTELMGLIGLMLCTIGLLGIVRLYLKERIKPIRMGGRVDWGLRLIKVALLLSIAPTTWYFDTLFFTDYDPIGGITATLPELILNPSSWSGNEFFWYKGIFVVAVIILVAFVERGWCRFLCPIGAMYGPANKFSLTDIEFRKEDCIHCQMCLGKCPMGINPKEDKRDPECIRCGKCYEVCPTKAQAVVPVNASIRGVFKR